MARLCYVIPVAALACGALTAVAAPAANEKIDVTGGWNFTVELAGNTGSPVFVLKQDGEKLTGTYKGQFGEADLKGTVKGDKIEFAFDISGNKIAYSGTIKKDNMEGEADYAGQATATWTGKKINVNGTWNCEVAVGDEAGTPVFTLKQEGEKLTGKYKGRFGEAEVSGTVKGDKIEINFTIEGGKIVYKGSIDRDSMKGDVDFAGQASGTFTGKRKVEK